MNNNVIVINLIKDEDKKHSVKFKPATDEDKKLCSAFYLARPASNSLDKIKLTIESV